MSTDYCSFICLSWSYSSQVTPVCLLHSEKRGKIVLPYVFNMVFPTSPLSLYLTLSYHYPSTSPSTPPSFRPSSSPSPPHFLHLLLFSFPFLHLIISSLAASPSSPSPGDQLHGPPWLPNDVLERHVGLAGPRDHGRPGRRHHRSVQGAAIMGLKMSSIHSILKYPGP